MAIEKIHIGRFLELTEKFPILDVRSPGEFNHAHIPGAISLPLFTDEERKVVGTAYKQQGRRTAIKLGLDFFGPKMRRMVETVEKIVESWPLVTPSGAESCRADNGSPQRGDFHPETTSDRQGSDPAFDKQGAGRASNGQGAGPVPDKQNAELLPTDLNTGAVQNNRNTHSIPILVHCWRGGMRSAGVAWLLDLYGFKVYTLTGGYKAFRSWAIQQFTLPHHFNILGGFTGSGKTEVLKELERIGEITIDLEALAGHKGSAFGNIGLPAQPTQEMFENKLAIALQKATNRSKVTGDKPIWLEDESQRIGTVNIPQPLWLTMRNSPIYFMDIPFRERLEHIVAEYGSLDKEKVREAICRLQKRLGGLETKTAIQYLQDGNIRESFGILLKYYDKYYQKGLNNRSNLQRLLRTVSCTSIQAAGNAGDVLKHTQSITV